MTGDAQEIGGALQLYPRGPGIGRMTNFFSLMLRVLVVAVVIWVVWQFMPVLIVPLAVALVVGLVVGGVVLSVAAAVVTVLVAALLVLAAVLAPVAIPVLAVVGLVALCRRRDAPAAGVAAA
jgi:hypothetical protein